MNRSKISYPTLSLDPLLLFRLKIWHKTFHLVTQFEKDPFLHIYLTIIDALPLLHCMSLTLEASTDPLWQIAMKEKLDALSKNHSWDLMTLPSENLWLVVSESTRLRLALMGPLSATKLVLLQKVLHKSMRLIIKRPLLWLLISHLFVPS